MPRFPFQGIKEYLKLGIGVEIARNILFNFDSMVKKPISIPVMFAKKTKWNLIAFLAGYVAIYRVNEHIF